MSTILVTGASGLIGRALAVHLSEKHQVICLDQRQPALHLPNVTARIESREDLQQLDRYDIEVMVHLAGVTGSCSERDALIVNVEGTRCLMRYLLDHGCRKFVMASSIAVVGLQNVKFRPEQLPFADEAPCLDRDGYGFSKYLLEQVARYYHRQHDEADMIALRLASTFPDDALPPLVTAQPLHEWAMATVTIMALSDTVRAFTMAAEARHKPGVRIMNVTPPLAWVKDPMATILRAWYGDEVDVSHFEQPGHEWDSLYDVHRVEAELGFVAYRLPDNT
ncbi:MAG: NAD-dependent epimerase/dehydratase family protein [Candidatus Entotheonellia bacterium]